MRKRLDAEEAQNGDGTRTADDEISNSGLDQQPEPNTISGIKRRSHLLMEGPETIFAQAEEKALRKAQTEAGSLFRKSSQKGYERINGRMERIGWDGRDPQQKTSQRSDPFKRPVIHPSWKELATFVDDVADLPEVEKRRQY